MYKYTVQVPPIRTPLTEMDLAGSALSGNAPQPTNTNAGNGTNQPPRTAKEWYRFWNQSANQINSNSSLVTSGSHAARPDPANTPDGALYFETDRGVLYQLRNGQWWYVAGIMYSTLNPDTRPTDLGVTDGGFEFGSTDTSPPRHFIWSQTQWVDVSSQWVNGSGGAIYYNGGYVGIGSATPASMLSVTNSASPATGINSIRYANDATAPIIYEYKSRGTPASPQPVQANDALGYLGFGGRATSGTTVDGASINCAATGVGANSLTADLVFMTNDGSSVAGTERMRITGAGNVGIGTSNPAVLLTVNGPARAAQILCGVNAQSFSLGDMSVVRDSNPNTGVIFLGTGGARYLQFDGTNYQMPGGNLVVNGVTVPSDLRLKENIRPVIDDSVALLRQLNFVRYEHNGLGGTDRGAKGIGLVAQELADVLPEAVRPVTRKLRQDDSAETEILAIDYQHLWIHAMRAIVELERRIKELERDHV